MKFFSFSVLVIITFCSLYSISSARELEYEKAPGGYRNPWPKLYNKDHPGQGSKGQRIYNKMQIPGKTMSIKETAIYDNQGNVRGTAVASEVGYVNGKRDGGVNAGSIAQIKIEGVDTTCVLMFTLNIKEGGRMSGWVALSSLSPSEEIEKIQREIKSRLLKIRPSDKGRKYETKEVIDFTLPKEAEEWYLMAGREKHKSQGKAKYYFTRRGCLYGLVNIPETGSQRYGVTYDVAPVGAIFHQDVIEPMVSVDIYPPSAEKPSSYKLQLVYGYFQTSSGEKRHCWTNVKCLK